MKDDILDHPIEDIDLPDKLRDAAENCRIYGEKFQGSIGRLLRNASDWLDEAAIEVEEAQKHP